MTSSLTGMMSPQRESLELLLQGVIQDSHVFWKMSQDNRFFRRVISPYLLPIAYSEGMWRGVFNFEGTVLSAPIGLSYTSDHRARYFTIGLKKEDADVLSLFEEDRKDGVLYLPIKFSGTRLSIGNDTPSGRVTYPGSPHQIMGVSGLDEEPLISVYEKSGALVTRGVFLHEDGTPDFFSFKNLQGNLRRMNKLHRALLKQRNRGTKLSYAQIEKMLRDLPGLRVETPVEGIEALFVNDEEWEKPTSIMRLLDEYIIGNAAAKKAVAVSFAQYMTRKRTGDINIPHDHILLFGPEGVGKGYMLKLLAQKAKLPYQHIVWGAGADSNENFGTLGKTFSIGTTPYGLLIIEGIDRGGIPPQGEIGRILASSSDVYFTLRGDGGFINSGNLLWAFILSQGQETNGSSNREITRKENVLSNDDRSDAAVPTRNPFSASLITPLLTQIPIQMEMQALDSSEKARALFTKGSPLALYREALRWRGYSLTLKENAARDLALTAPRSEGGVSGVMERCHALLSEVLMDPAKYANARREITIDVELVREILPSSQYLRGNMK